MPPVGGIRTHDPSKRSAADLRLRPRGHWDRPCIPKYSTPKAKEKPTTSLRTGQLYILYFVTCTNIVISDFVTLILFYERVPEDGLSRDRNLSDRHINIII
jgi:hypothetical protein